MLTNRVLRVEASNLNCFCKLQAQIMKMKLSSLPSPGGQRNRIAPRAPPAPVSLGAALLQQQLSEHLLAKSTSSARGGLC